VQSFDDEALKILGRIHSANEAKKAIETVSKAGFDNFNIDLMFGLPQQDKAKALLDIDTALSFAPTHLSYYQLTMEPNTYFASHPPALPDEDDIDDWLLLNQQRLADAGYQQYETSAYAQSGKQCRHNLNYWQFGDYLGIGAGAHSKITRADTQSIHRMVKHKHPQRYQETAGSDDCLLENTQVAIEDVGFEFMLNAMRLIEGVPTHLFQQYTGVPLSRFKSAFENAEQQGLLEHSIHRLKPTYQGQRFLNTLIDCFIP
jgi:oxygen-independent coproporphyrinogen-3 oxidase